MGDVADSLRNIESRDDAWRSFDASSLANRATSALRAYDPGHDLPALRKRFGDAIAELGSNENPLGPSPRAVEAMRNALSQTFRYPDPRGLALKTALAGRLGVEIDRVALGNGSHELLMLLAQCFADRERSIVFSQFGFAVFPIGTAAAGAIALRAPALARDHASAPYGHDLDAIAAAIRGDTRVVYVANPNNPTGTWFDDAALARFVERVPRHVLIVVDEAYFEYVDAEALTTALKLADRHPNLIVTRTFSKAYGLAGVRIGYLVAHPSVVAIIERLRESFNVNSVALAAAEAALGDAEHLAQARAFNRAERTWLCERLAERGYVANPSQTNFVLVDLGRDAATFEAHLLERGVVVRPMGGYGLSQTVRISIGSRAENQRLVDALP
jgi:histidinol-phosphate aminotransferase